MQRRTRVSSALAGLVALGLACSACTTGGPADDDRTGLQRPTTRAAFQVSVGSVLAIIGGELLST
ncbi:hypothetical protein DLE01_13210, partial [Streptomyces sp. FT05W]